MPDGTPASLWPDTLDAPDQIDFKAFLQVQADGLKQLVRNALEASVEVRPIESLINYKFILTQPQTGYRYELFSIRTVGGAFPARIVAGHMAEPDKVIPVSSRDELESQLRRIFHAPATIKIIRQLEELNPAPEGPAGPSGG